MDRLTKGFIAGSIGCIVKSTLNTITAKSGMMYLRNSTVGSDLVLGKTLLKRKGTVQYLVGELASTMLGAIWGSLMGAAPAPQGERAWVARGIQVGSIAWFFDQSMGVRALPRSIQGSVRPVDSLIWFTQHLAFGIVASYLLDGNPQLLDDAWKKIVGLVEPESKTDRITDKSSPQLPVEDLVHIPYWIP